MLTKSELHQLDIGNETLDVEWLERNEVKPGVNCDVYRIRDDQTRDVAIIRIDPGCASPRQQVVKGDQTIEGFLEGGGRLWVERWNDGTEYGKVEDIYQYYPEQTYPPVTVESGQIMQWYAGRIGLVYYELCVPPYQEGRFRDLPDKLLPK